MKKIIFLIGTVLYGVFATPQITPAACEEEAVPTTVFKVSGAGKQIYWIGTQHTFDWEKNVHSAVKGFLADLALQSSTYFVGERNVNYEEGYKVELEEAISGYANLARYDQDYWGSLPYNDWKSLLPDKVDELFKKVAQNHGETLAGVLRSITSDASQQSWLPAVHPLIAQMFIQNALDDFAIICNEDRTLFVPMEDHIKSLFKKKKPLYFETASDLIAAYASVEELRDRVKFEEAVNWFLKGCPYTFCMTPAFTTRTELPIMKLITRYPLLEFEEDASWQRRNIAWKKNLKIFMQERPTDVPIGDVGAAHLGGERGMLNASYQLLLEQCSTGEAPPTITQLWSNGEWRLLPFDPKLFTSLPSSAPQGDKDLLEEVKSLLSSNQ